MKNLFNSHYARLSLIGQFYRQYSTVAAVSCGFLVVFSSSSMVKIWSVTYCRDFEFDYELGTLIITTIYTLSAILCLSAIRVLETGSVASNSIIGQLLGTNFDVKFYRFDTLFCHSKKSAPVYENVTKHGNFSSISHYPCMLLFLY